MSDNGPPFNSCEFQQFATNYDVEHVTSSPCYPQSNGKVENAIETAKSLLKKSKAARSDIYLALLEWRNTPSKGRQHKGCSSAESSGRCPRKTLQEETSAIKVLQYQW